MPVCLSGLYKLDRTKEKPSQINQPAIVETEEGEDEGEVTRIYACVAPCGFGSTTAISS